MKKHILIFGFFLLCINISSQSLIDKYYDKYSGTEGYTSVYISKYMFDMFKNNQGNVNVQGDMEQVISKLDCIKIIATDDDPSTPVPVNLYNDIMKSIPSSSYKEVMIVKDKDQNVNIYMKEVKDKIAELLLVIGGTDGQVLISIQGDIDMNSIAKIASSMNIEGMENLEKLENQ